MLAPDLLENQNPPMQTHLSIKRNHDSPRFRARSPGPAWCRAWGSSPRPPRAAARWSCWSRPAGREPAPPRPACPAPWRGTSSTSHLQPHAHLFVWGQRAQGQVGTHRRYCTYHTVLAGLAPTSQSATTDRSLSSCRNMKDYFATWNVLNKRHQRSPKQLYFKRTSSTCYGDKATVANGDDVIPGYRLRVFGVGVCDQRTNATPRCQHVSSSHCP